MVDIGHRQTDKVLERLEKRLAEEYAQAYKDVKKKAADYFKRFEVKDKQKKALVDAGKLTEEDYQTWRRNQMLSGKRWTDLRDQLAKDLTNTNQIAAGIVRGELNEVFAINANYSEYMIENGMRTNYGFTLYDRNTIANLVANDPDIIPWKPEVDVKADLRWNRQMITSHITQGILQGESIPNLSKRLLKTVNNDKVAAVRTARTAVTSSQNAGRQMVYDRAKRMGLKLQKCWMATLDARTRHEHGAVDGQKVPLDGQFTVGGYKMKFPGDMSAPPHLTYNCRCTTITVEPDYITKGEEPRMTYSEWVESKEGKEAIQKKKDAEKQKREKEKEKQNKQKEKQTAKQKSEKPTGNVKKMESQYKETDAMNEYDYFSKEQEQFRLDAIRELTGYGEADAVEALHTLCGDGEAWLRSANAGTEYQFDAWFYGGDSRIRQAKDGEFYEKAKIIDRYVENAPKYEGTIYRGMALDDDEIRAFSVGSVFKENGNLSSWSSKADVGEMFAQGRSEELSKRPVVLRTKNPPHGTPASHLSIFGSEESEVLVSNMKESEYIVEAVEEKNGIVYVDMILKRG